MHSAVALLSLSALTIAVDGFTRHDGPDPLWHWQVLDSRIRDGKLEARFGPALEIRGTLSTVTDAGHVCGWFDGKSALILENGIAAAATRLPKEHLTIATWASIETPRQFGGLFSLFQDNGNAEAGVVLGYDESVFTIGLASEGANDGDGKMTYLRGKTRYEAGRIYHVAATYDGKTMRLYVNGVLDAASEEQSGAVFWPKSAALAVGAYHDRNEHFPHHGRIRDLAVYDLAASDKWVAHEFEHGKELAASPAVVHYPDELGFVVAPYQQWVTESSVTVMWETSRPATSVLMFGRNESNLAPVTVAGNRLLHTVRVDDLEPLTAYFFRVESSDDRRQALASPLLTTRTAPKPGDDTPIAFVVIGDTQDQPVVAKRIAKFAFGMRPDFAVIAGDLVGTGPNKSHWTEQFFPSMQMLIERVAFFPVLGNHEQDAHFYYDYVALPEPEYYYTFRYGTTQFFMLDSNREVAPGSEQYEWLDKELGKSSARWKFVVYHHPSYSSDDDDYGDMWKGPSTHGDVRVRQLTPLYDRHGVDIVWNGHIHSYERTWPLRGNRAVESNGTIYIVTGGGGGRPERAGPIRPYFQNNVREGHHFCFVAIHGDTLEFKAFDFDNDLYDVTTIRKQ
ncbi:MAG: LamG-like jellyroll fold domain-containing protein [Planctomycetota bacterium]